MPDTLTAPASAKTESLKTEPAKTSTDVALPVAGGELSEGEMDFEGALQKMEERMKVKTEPPKTEKAAEAPPEKKEEAPAKAAEAKTDLPKEEAKGEPIPPNAGPKWFRQKLDEFHGELTQARSALAAAQSKLAEAEKRGKETSVLAERVATRTRERDEALANLSAAKQELSPEFKAKFEKPFEQEADRAQRRISEMNVVDESGEAVGKADFNKHFVPLYRLPYADAEAMANSIFGEHGGPRVMALYDRLHDLEDNKNIALEQEKSRWQETIKAEDTKRIQQREALAAIQDKVDGDVREKLKDFVEERPGDADWNAALKESKALLDQKPANLEQTALLRSLRRHLAIAAQPLAADNKKLRAENAQLRETIEKMKGAGPGPGKGAKAEESAKELSLAEELRQKVGLPSLRG